MAKILVIGASRGIGLEAVRCGLAEGHHVRALARSADRIPITHERLEKLPGDVLDPERLSLAVDGVDAVIQAIGVAASAERLLKPVSLFSESTLLLVQAMKAAGVRRLISVTGFGAGDSRRRLGCLRGAAHRLLLGRAYDDKDAQEALIRESDLDWVIARPVILVDGPRTGRYRVELDPKRWRYGLISRANVADFLVKQVQSDEHIGRTPVLLSCPL
ncbi:MAG: SDR family oxidoreductase [Kiloniellales bacterium]|nr:SDR family oxidoreductase [Kiloniellales bacterium]